MRLRGVLILAGLVLAATAGTLLAQEIDDSMVESAPDDLVQSIRVDAAERLGIELENVQIAISQPIEWSDASLGCPQGQSAFSQVITPGFLIVVDVGGNRLSYHTDAGSRFVLCADTKPWRPRPVGFGG
jgi:hypothetical protein